MLKARSHLRTTVKGMVVGDRSKSRWEATDMLPVEGFSEKAGTPRFILPRVMVRDTAEKATRVQ